MNVHSKSVKTMTHSDYLMAWRVARRDLLCWKHLLEIDTAIVGAVFQSLAQRYLRDPLDNAGFYDREYHDKTHYATMTGLVWYPRQRVSGYHYDNHTFDDTPF